MMYVLPEAKSPSVACAALHGRIFPPNIVTLNTRPLWVWEKQLLFSTQQQTVRQ